MARSVARRRGARFRAGMIGLAMLAGAGFFLYVALTAPQGLPFASHTFRKVAVSDVGDLAVGNDVRVAQVRVGRVDDIALQNGTAVVTIQLDDPNSPVYKDGSVAVTARSGLGQQYLDLQPGTPAAGPLGPDDVLPVTRSRGSVQLLDLAKVFDAQTQQAASSALKQLGNGAAGHGQDLHDFLSQSPQILPDLGTVSSSLATNDGQDITGTLQALKSLTGRFDDRQQQISELVGQLDTTLAAVNADGGDPLRRTLDAAPGAMTSVRKALQDLQQPLQTTTSALTQLAPGAQALADATPDLRGVLTEAPQPLGKLPDVADKATPALEDLTPVLTAARPVGAKVAEAVDFAHTPLQVLAPYSPEIAQWFTNASFALSDGDTAGHWLRFTLLPRAESVTGAAGLADPLRTGDAYPAPGQVPNQKSSGVLPLPLGGTP
jgi:phospholipid/cholesterol/gamma-HCH transport system substrate-binding protein